MGSIRLRGRIWYIDYRWHGKRIKERVGPTKSLAKEVLAKREAEVAEGRFFPQRARQSITFREFAEKFWRLNGQYHSPVKTRNLLNKLVGFWGDMRLADITPLSVTEMRCKVKETAKAATANRYHILLKSMLNRAIEWEDLWGENPARKVKLEKMEGHRLRFLSQEEISRFMAALKPRSHPLISCALLTGMRKGEIMGLVWENVDLEHGTIYLLKTKSGKPREVPISPKLAKILENLGPKKEGKVFEIAAMSLRRDFENALKAAQIHDFRFHDLRHTFASHFVMKTHDLPALQAILGHSTPIMTQRYAHLSKGHMLANMQMFDSGISLVPNWSQNKVSAARES